MFIVGTQNVDGGYRWFMEHPCRAGARLYQRIGKKRQWPKTIGGAKKAFRHFIRKHSNVIWKYADSSDGICVKQMDIFGETS